VRPAEKVFEEQVKEGDRWQPTAIMEELKREARARKLWNLFLPESELGAGFTNLEYSSFAELTGFLPAAVRGHELLGAGYRQHGGARALRQPGPAGALAQAALAGEIRSAFCMTEPDVASSDATNIQSRIESDATIRDQRAASGRRAPALRAAPCLISWARPTSRPRHLHRRCWWPPRDTTHASPPTGHLAQRNAHTSFGYVHHAPHMARETSGLTAVRSHQRTRNLRETELYLAGTERAPRGLRDHHADQGRPGQAIHHCPPWPHRRGGSAPPTTVTSLGGGQHRRPGLRLRTRRAARHHARQCNSAHVRCFSRDSSIDRRAC
jgi:hypothetical protein